jgi:hypothetical protein
MTTCDTSPERKAFEAWMRERFPSAPLYRRDMKGSLRFGQYCSSAVEDQWETWKARGAIASPSVSIADTAGAKADEMRDAAMRTVQAMGYEWHGGDRWKPCIAATPAPRMWIETGDFGSDEPPRLVVDAATPASSVADAAGASGEPKPLDGKPTERGIYAWIAEGSAALVHVHTRPTDNSQGGFLNGSILRNCTFYEGCAIDQWSGGKWFGPLNKAAIAKESGND